MIDPMLKVWDAAAAMPIIEQAGGTFTDWQGHPSTVSGDAVAANCELWPQVIEITRTAPPYHSTE